MQQTILPMDAILLKQKFLKKQAEKLPPKSNSHIWLYHWNKKRNLGGLSKGIPSPECDTEKVEAVRLTVDEEFAEIAQTILCRKPRKITESSCPEIPVNCDESVTRERLLADENAHDAYSGSCESIVATMDGAKIKIQII